MQVDSRLRDQAHAGFRFVVEVANQKLAVFTECTLPAIEWEIEEVKEGGVNTYTHQVPGRRKAVKITFKNGVGKSELLDWYLKAMSGAFARKPVTVMLLDAQRAPVVTWRIENAFPSKWSGPDLKADSNTVAIQSLELAGGEITVS
jgi:phage tail-like protein